MNRNTSDIEFEEAFDEYDLLEIYSPEELRKIMFWQNIVPFAVIAIIMIIAAIS